MKKKLLLLAGFISLLYSCSRYFNDQGQIDVNEIKINKEITSNKNSEEIVSHENVSFLNQVSTFNDSNNVSSEITAL